MPLAVRAARDFNRERLYYFNKVDILLLFDVRFLYDTPRNKH